MSVELVATDNPKISHQLTDEIIEADILTNRSLAHLMPKSVGANDSPNRCKHQQSDRIRPDHLQSDPFEQDGPEDLNIC